LSWFEANGDGSADTITAWNQTQVTHNFTTPGVQNINITGIIWGWMFNNGGDCQKLTGISQWGSLRLGNTGNFFYGCSNLVLTATDAPDLTGTTTLANTFRNCVNLGSTGNMSGWDVSNVTSTSGMFFGASTFNQSIDAWNVSSVTTMYQMFRGASSFNQPIGAWNVSHVADMNYMFWGASSFNQPIGAWDVSQVTSMFNMFTWASAFNQPIGAWNVSHVTSMASMFLNAISFNQPIGSWDVSHVTSMNSMFAHAPSFNQFIGAWDVSHVTDMRYMFLYASLFNQPIGAWDVSHVTNMYGMFYSVSSFNPPIGAWNVSHVTDMSIMFSGASSFNQPIGAWNVSNVLTMYRMFEFASSINESIGAWNVSRVTDMRNMFYGALSFNQPIGAWNVSHVTDMSNMFTYASKYNQSVEAWDVSHVTNMRDMFHNASSFNQPIGAWNVSCVTDMRYMFTNVALSTINYDCLLQGWSMLNLQVGVNLDAGDSVYSSAAASARAFIISNFGWTILDGGGPTPVAPSAPLGIVATAGIGQVTLTWMAPSDNGGSAITNYRIFMGTSTGAETVLATVGNVATYTATGLTPGQAYYFKVAAINAVGTGANSSEVKSTPFGIPSAPQILVASPGDRRVMLAWASPLSNGGSPIIGYRIYRGTTSHAKTLLAAVGNTTFYVDTNVTNGITYYYTIAALNSAGEGSQLIEISATPINTTGTSTTELLLAGVAIGATIFGSVAFCFALLLHQRDKKALAKQAREFKEHV
jgi:surface protein